MPTDELKERIPEMKEASEALKGVQRAGDLTHADPRFVDFILKCSPANVLALIAKIERQHLGARVALSNAQLIDRIRVWSKCADGYPLDEHINNIATKLERLERADLAQPGKKGGGGDECSQTR